MADTPENLNNVVHTPAWWDADDARAEAQLDPFRGLLEEDLTPQVLFQLFCVAVDEIRRLRLVDRVLAVDSHPKQTHGRRSNTKSLGNGREEG